MAKQRHIKGHSNCTPEKCYSGECLVVLCSIHLGFEKAEVVEDEDEKDTTEEKENIYKN